MFYPGKKCIYILINQRSTTQTHTDIFIYINIVCIYIYICAFNKTSVLPVRWRIWRFRRSKIGAYSRRRLRRQLWWFDSRRRRWRRRRMPISGRRRDHSGRRRDQYLSHHHQKIYFYMIYFTCVLRIYTHFNGHKHRFGQETFFQRSFGAMRKSWMKCVCIYILSTLYIYIYIYIYIFMFFCTSGTQSSP